MERDQRKRQVNVRVEDAHKHLLDTLAYLLDESREYVVARALQAYASRVLQGGLLSREREALLRYVTADAERAGKEQEHE